MQSARDIEILLPVNAFWKGGWTVTIEDENDISSSDSMVVHCVSQA